MFFYYYKTKYLHSDLTNSSEFSKNLVHLFGRDFVWQIFDVEDAIDLWRQLCASVLTTCHSHDEANKFQYIFGQKLRE